MIFGFLFSGFCTLHYPSRLLYATSLSSHLKPHTINTRPVASKRYSATFTALDSPMAVQSGFCVMNQIAQSIYLMTCWVVQTDLCNLATGKQLNCRHKDDFRDPFVNYHQTTIAARVPECDFSLLYWSPLTSLIPRPEDLRLQDWEWE